MNLRRTLLCALTLLGALSAYAVPARPGVTRVRQPDGRIVPVRIIGDEWANRTLSEEGYAIGRGRDGIFRLQTVDESGQTVLSGYAVSEEAPAALRAKSAALGARARAALGRRVAPTAAGGPQALSRLRKVLVIPVQFADLAFSHSRDRFEDFLSGESYSYRGATGSVREYFLSQLGADLAPAFTLAPVVTLTEGYAYYGENDASGRDRRAHQAAVEACRLSDASVDFSAFDAVVLLYAGANPADGGADDDHLWPAKYDRDLRTDEKTFPAYALASELMLDPDTGRTNLAGIGVFCHEFAHLLGLPDFYDIDDDGSLGQSTALWGSTSLMDRGTYNHKGHTPPCLNAVELTLLGLVEPEPLAVGDYDLAPLSEQRRVLWADSGTEGEYFLFECRAPSGWDAYIGADRGGLLIYHIDMSDGDAGYSESQGMNLTARQRWSVNEINTNPTHPCADLLEADPAAGEIARVFFPAPGITTFSASSAQPFVSWSGEPSPLSLGDMERVGSRVRFRVSGPVAMDRIDVFQDAVILSWHTQVAEFQDSQVSVMVAATNGDNAWLDNVSPYEPGRYAATFERLSPQTEYRVTIRYVSAPNADESALVQTFTTKPFTGLPFIYLNDAERVAGRFKSGTKIPLRVYNAEGATSVGWFLDGVRIGVAEDGYYTVTRGGLLKAEVNYADGTTDIITKQIVLQ